MIFSMIARKYGRLSQLRKNVVSGILFSAADILITLFAYPVYLKFLGAKEYGMWATASVVLAFSQFGELGIGTALIKFIAAAYGRKDRAAVKEYASTALFALMLPAGIILSVIVLFDRQITSFLKMASVATFHGVSLVLCVGFLSVVSLFTNVIRSILVGIGRIDLVNYILAGTRAAQVTLAVFFLATGWGVWSLYFAYLLYFLVPAFLTVFLIRRIYNIRIFDPAAFRVSKLKELVRFGGVFLSSMVANMLVMPFNKIIIARYIGLSEVTYYEIAERMVMAIRSLFVRGLEALLPKVSEITGPAGSVFKEISTVHHKGMKLIYRIALPLFLSVFLFAQILLPLWLGNRYDPRILILVRILVFGWFINALAVPDYFVFLGIGKERVSAGAQWLHAALNVGILLAVVFLGKSLTLNVVATIKAASLVLGTVYLKLEYLAFRRRARAGG